MKTMDFAHSEEEYAQFAADTLAEARRQGADAAEVVLGESSELNVSVRAGQPENIDSGLSLSARVTVYVGKQEGAASANSFASADLAKLVERALAIAKQMNADDCNGLPEQATLFRGVAPDLDLYHPWRPSVAQALALAGEIAEASWAVDARVSKEKSEGASVSTGVSRGVLANSFDFTSVVTRSSTDYACQALVELDEGMESAGWHEGKLARADLPDHREVGRRAGERAVARAGARPIKSAKVPVLFESGAAHGLVRALLGGISGSAVYRKLTYLAEALGQQVCADHFGLREEPLQLRSSSSAHHDSEGVCTQAKDIIANGKLCTCLLASYSGRRLKSPSTGNAGGARNVQVAYREQNLNDLLREMDCGLFVTGTMGGGANFVTGDYSAGAHGFWVENGVITHPVKDATIAGDLREMYKGIVAGGTDRRTLGDMDCGSLLLAQLAVGGS